MSATSSGKRRQSSGIALPWHDREDEQVAYLRQWIDDANTGDVDDLPFLLTNDLRPRIVSFPDDCIGRNCGHFEDNCFVNRMRDKARQAQVIITNHHLLLNALELGGGWPRDSA